MSDATPTFEQVLLTFLERSTSKFFVELPARVDAYDEERQCVDATPWPLAREVLEDDTVVNRQYPTVLSAPVIFPGAGPYRITFPIALGSTVMLRFTSANLSKWLALGGQVASIDGRRHDLCSAVADPGGHSFAGISAPSTTAPTDAMVLHGPKLRLGGPDADDPVSRMSDLQQVLDYAVAVNARLTAHTHAVATTGTAAAQSGTAAPTAAASPSTPSPTGSAVTFTE